MEWYLAVGWALTAATAAVKFFSDRRTRRRLERQLAEVPEQTAQRLSAVLERVLPSAAKAALDAGSAEGLRAYVGVADVTGDGEQELLVMHPAGVHASALKVYGWRGLEFTLLGEVGTTCPASFHVEDVDGDGRLEVATVDVPWGTDRPYVTAERVETIYRWNGTGFERVTQGVRHDPLDEGSQPPERINALYGPPNWASDLSVTATGAAATT